MGLFFLVCSKNIIQKYQWGNYAPWPPICALTVINSHLRETVTAMWPVMKTSLTPLPVSSLAVSAAGKRFARRVLRGHNNEKLRKEIQLPLETRWHLEIQMRDFLPHKLKSGMIQRAHVFTQPWQLCIFRSNRWGDCFQLNAVWLF